MGNHRRKEEDGFEPLLLQLIPYIRAVFSRYWSLHFTRTDNPALASVKLYSSHQHPRSYEAMRSMTPREWALHLLPQVDKTRARDFAEKRALSARRLFGFFCGWWEY